MTADPKPTFKKGNRPRRIVDPAAIAAAKFAHPLCAACGERTGDGHHVLPKDKGGDDVVGNIVVLCGSGTSGCHGAHHGNPYVVDGARRDAAWVNRRVGRTLVERRPDVVWYVLGKLGETPGREFLFRHYFIERTP